MSNQEVLFVYVGGSLPAYATASLKLSRIHSGLETHLIASAATIKALPKGIAKLTPIDEFYDASIFDDLRSQVMLAHSFREGFWLSSFERLLVLEQFMKATNTRSVFHAELDQLLFRTDVLLANLEKLESPGIRLPFHNPTAALASVMHVQGHGALSHLLEFARKTKPFKNEMELLARWGNANPDKLQALPTLASALLPDYRNLIYPVETIDISFTQGITDAAQVGQWIAGVDARNLAYSERPMNHHVDPASTMLLSREHLASTQFIFDQNSGELQAKVPGGQLLPIYNLHVHSKAHAWINSRSQNLSFLIDRANRVTATPVPGVRGGQLNYKIIMALRAALNSPQNAKSFLRMKINKWTLQRPSSAPHLSGDTFRSLTKNRWDSHSRSIRPRRLGDNNLVFLEPELLKDFEANVLYALKVPITLLIGNSDINHGDSLKFLTKHPMVNRVFAQNLTQEVPEAEILPIGLENRWRAANGHLSLFRKRYDPSAERQFRIMWCFSVHTNLDVRVAATNDLSECELADKFDNLSRKEHQEKLRSYAFVASPPGNGLDTHRTWEAMYQGCVPILLRSYLADSYWNLGLPVWVVGSYGELAANTEAQLREKYAEIQPRFSSEALWIDFWRARFLEASSSS